MTDAVELIQRFRTLIYLGLGIGAVWYLRAFFRAHRRLRFSLYGLERETHALARAKALTMLVLVTATVGLVYLLVSVDLEDLATFGADEPTAGPVLMTQEPTATFDQPVLLPGQPTATLSGTPTLVPENTLVPAGSVGCDNPQATIRSPLPGAVLAGPVEVQGTADIPNFAFYVLEISTLGDNWLTVFTGNTPVSNEVLGSWDASLQEVGNYGFRLVVFDATGAFPEPCVIPITIGGSP